MKFGKIELDARWRCRLGKTFICVCFKMSFFITFRILCILQSNCWIEIYKKCSMVIKVIFDEVQISIGQTVLLDELPFFFLIFFSLRNWLLIVKVTICQRRERQIQENDVVCLLRESDEMTFAKIFKTKHYHSVYWQSWNDSFLLRQACVCFLFTDKNSI